MIKKLLPTYIANSSREIPPSFYKKINKKAILFDLDNTLDPVNIATPSKEAENLISSLKKEGFKIYIASNNTGKRVATYCKDFQIGAASGLMKPFSRRLKKWIKKTGFKKEEVILVGDQIFTDVIAAKGAGIDVILVKPLSKVDSIFTIINRRLEKPIRAKIEKKKLVKSWEDIL